MGNLHEDHATLGMHSLDKACPALDMSIGVDAGDAPPNLDRLAGGFPAASAQVGLDAPEQIMSAIGAFWPSALCGRSSLSSLRQASNFVRVSSRLMNQCTFRHSVRNFPLKDSMIGMKRMSALRGAALAAACFLGWTTSPAMAAPDRHQDWSKLHMLFLIWTYNNNPYFVPMLNGVQDAAKAEGIKVDVEYGNEDLGTMNNIIETALANGTNGVAVTISDDNALNSVLCKAMKQGIPVIAFSQDNSKGANGGTCRLAFIGQSFFNTGYVLGKRMVEQYHLGKGDLVFTPVEAPQAVYAVQRHGGVAKALAEVGARTEILATTNDHAHALDVMTQYLLGHSNVKAIIGLGQTPTSQAVQALHDAGVTGVPAAGFDVDSEIISDIENGSLTATADQQPYQQGYMTVTEMAEALKFGIVPADLATGGTGLIDKTNVGLAKEWAGVTR
jgi:simple sugar transport system substrate-binding protein